ncbi:MAG: restriction endonuclease subunit M [Gemmatimonadales bacterium]|nr:restriction endonuclease subunit M [Gemmatimonadales bacterium]
MMEGWQTKKLGELCDISLGKTPARAITAFWDEKRTTDNVWLSIADLLGATEGVVLDSKEYLSNVGAALCRPVRQGTLLVSFKLTLGRLAFAGRDLFTNEAIAALTISNEQELSKAYLFYFLHFFDWDKATEGDVKIKGKTLNKEKLKAIDVHFPPAAEQERIVRVLDQAFEGIATAKSHTERNLQNVRAVFEGHLQEVFSRRGAGWETKRIADIARHSLGKMLDKAKNKGRPQPYLRNINVRWFAFDLSDLLQMRFLPTELEKYTAVKGDVLICEGGYPGRAAIWNEDFPIYFQKALHRVRFHEPMHSKWFVYYLYVQDKSGELKRQFTGTGIQHFTGEVLARFPLPLPPLGELPRLMAMFDELFVETQRLESIYQRKLGELESLKKSLLHHAFTGQL